MRKFVLQVLHSMLMVNLNKKNWDDTGRVDHTANLIVKSIWKSNLHLLVSVWWNFLWLPWEVQMDKEQETALEWNHHPLGNRDECWGDHSPRLQEPSQAVLHQVWMWECWLFPLRNLRIAEIIKEMGKQKSTKMCGNTGENEMQESMATIIPH